MAKRTSKPRRQTSGGHVSPKVVTATPLLPAHRKFALTYLANGFNATQAYLAVYPHVTVASASEMGSRLLRNVKVSRFVQSRIEAVCKPLHMGGDEALAHIAIIARDERLKPRDRLQATRILLEVSGKVKGNDLDELAAALRATLERTATRTEE